MRNQCLIFADVRPAKFLWRIALALVLAFVGLGVYARWSLQHMHLEFPIGGLVPLVKGVALVAGSHGTCSAGVDDSSIGNRETEGEMSYVAAMTSLYRGKFGAYPSSASDLIRLPEFEHADSLNGRSFSRDCSIYFEQNASFVVSCGDSRPSSLEAAAFMRTAPFEHKFFMIGNSEILYVPVPKC